MKLMSETINYDVSVVTETNESGKKELYIEGVFAQAGVPNGNKRIYPEKVLLPEVEKYVTEFVDKNRAFGELDHPDGPMINLDKVSHIVTELKIHGKDIYGKAKVVDTPAGNILRGLLEAGGQVGVSTRGLGAVKRRRDGVSEVQDGFRLFAIDTVANPSAPDAFVNGIMEGKEWVLAEAGTIVDKEKLTERKAMYLKAFLETLT